MLDELLGQAGNRNNDYKENTLSFSTGAWLDLGASLDSLPGGVWDDDCGAEMSQKYFTPMRAQVDEANQKLEEQINELETAAKQSADASANIKSARQHTGSANEIIASGHAKNAQTGQICERSAQSVSIARGHMNECVKLLADAAQAGGSK